MFIITRSQNGEARYWNSNRRTWAWDMDAASEFSSKDAAWNSVNRIPGRLSFNEYHLDSDYSLIQL